MRPFNPLFLLLIVLPAFADVQTAENPEESKLQLLFDDTWEREMALNPTWASLLGDKRFNREWSDLSEAGRQAQRNSNMQALNNINAIDRELLTLAGQTNFDLFQLRYQDRIEFQQFEMDLIPISQRGGIQTLDELGDRLGLKAAQDFDDWLARLDQFDILMDQTIALMQQGMNKGMMPPRITMSRVPDQIAKQVVDSAEASLFYKPFKILPDSLSAEEQSRIRADAKQIIEAKVIPAYRRLQVFFIEEYLPACRDSIGASELPNGKALYEQRVRSFTTTDLTPDEVHEIGLAEVKRIRREMDEVIEQVGFEGSFQEFLEFLRTDPQFYYDSPQELFEGYLAVSKKIDPFMPLLFTRLPRMPYGLKAIPDAVAPDTTTAYYMRPSADGTRAGFYFVNLYKPETRPKYEMEVLTVHEAVPGHHMQIALQQELEGLPNFRRYSGFTVFVEGWGLYSERLGYDIGLYEDPYSRFGQLTYDMWRAVRLVVDTGMHYKGWTRRQAIDFFLANAAKSELDITNEIDRYISWPGQALAYKLGQMKISELRERSKQALGADFDLREFHDRVLENGSIPLVMLEANIDKWIAGRLLEIQANPDVR